MIVRSYLTKGDNRFNFVSYSLFVLPQQKSWTGGLNNQILFSQSSGKIVIKVLANLFLGEASLPG